MVDHSSPQEIAEQARRSYQTGDYAGAAQAYADSAATYAAAGDALMAAEMKNDRSVALLRAKQPQAALEAASGTDAVFAKAGDARREGIALANQAAALEALKKNSQAIDFYKRSAGALEKAGEGDLRAEVMQLLSVLYLRRFKLFDSIAALQSGLAGVRNPTPRQRLMKKILFIRL